VTINSKAGIIEGLKMYSEQASVCNRLFGDIRMHLFDLLY
jgi:hypothetical protein